MELSQGNSLGGYLYLKQAKIHFFFFLFSSTNRRTGGGTGSLRGGDLLSVGGQRWQGRRAGRKVNMVQKMCMYVCKCK
jgi:hypothetical protein